MIHPDTELRFISKEKGAGVVATAFIPRGTIVWVQDKLDLVFSEQDLLALGENYSEIMDTYSFRNQSGEYILCWDNARFVNHSFFANCITTPYNFEIAIRDIFEGEELTDDYGYLNVSKPFAPIDEGAERKVVYPDDLIQFYQKWDELLQTVFPEILSVEQPLLKFMDEQNKLHMNDVLTERKTLDSIRICYYDQKSASG